MWGEKGEDRREKEEEGDEPVRVCRESRLGVMKMLRAM